MKQLSLDNLSWYTLRNENASPKKRSQYKERVLASPLPLYLSLSLMAVVAFCLIYASLSLTARSCEAGVINLSSREHYVGT